ncbi:hypothetical protein ACWPKS_15920 [Coraliomargarita sp. W4R72]
MAKKTTAQLEAEIEALTKQVADLTSSLEQSNQNIVALDGELKESAAQLELANQHIKDLEAQLAKANAAPAANAGVALADAAKQFQARYAKEISAKVRAGLKQAQAIEAQEAQVREDARIEAAAKK